VGDGKGGEEGNIPRRVSGGGKRTGRPLYVVDRKWLGGVILEQEKTNESKRGEAMGKKGKREERLAPFPIKNQKEKKHQKLVPPSSPQEVRGGKG